MQQDIKLFNYHFIDNDADKTIFLLHGTGGSKEDFLFLNTALHKNFNLVGLQGNVDEQGSTRFFKRIKHGFFDQDSIKEESEKFQKFLTAWRETYMVNTEDFTFLGYSNGANMLLANLFYYPESMNKLALLHPMIPFEIKPHSIDLSQHHIFVAHGQEDPLVPISEQKKLLAIMQDNSAQIVAKEYPRGHAISRNEIIDVTKFLMES
jgi:phospholipase/carboxylesterase